VLLCDVHLPLFAFLPRCTTALFSTLFPMRHCLPLCFSEDASPLILLFITSPCSPVSPLLIVPLSYVLYRPGTSFSMFLPSTLFLTDPSGAVPVCGHLQPQWLPSTNPRQVSSHSFTSRFFFFLFFHPETRIACGYQLFVISIVF